MRKQHVVAKKTTKFYRWVLHMLRDIDLNPASPKSLEGGRRGRESCSFSSEMPVISVITVTYNCKNVLERTIKSVLDQRYTNIELIVIDGGSTDGTLDVIKRYDAAIQYWSSSPDRGIADAMNKGILKSSGDIVNFLNAGDYYVDEGVLDYVASWYREKNWQWAYGLANWLVEFKEQPFRSSYTPYRKWHYYYKNPTNHQATFYRRDLFQKIGLFREDLSDLFDLESFIKASQISRPETSPKRLVWFDVTGYSARSRTTISFLKKRMLLTKQYCDFKLGLPLWYALIFYRWCRSIGAFYVKKHILS